MSALRDVVVGAHTLSVHGVRVAISACGYAPDLLRHVLPKSIPAAVVLATLEMGELLLAMAGLGILGLGAQPPWPSGGAMLSEGRRLLSDAPYLYPLRAI